MKDGWSWLWPAARGGDYRVWFEAQGPEELGSGIFHAMTLEKVN